MVVIEIFAALQILLALIVALRLGKMAKVFKIKSTDQTARPIDTLPTVSLCIPARNETHAMTACLEQALQSNYPKLEIIVLDDGSRDTTQLLIKSFAHAGVRFIEGSKLPQGWLGKNHALDTLLRQASGSLLLFADVDTQFERSSIERMVDYMLNEEADMVSVMPIRNDTKRSSMQLATLRHFWTIFSHSSETPAASSSAWMVKRSVLREDHDGLQEFALDVRPELAIAKTLAPEGKYRFIVSSKYVGITSEKKLSSQRETAIRIYYPTFHGIGSVVRVVTLTAIVLPFYALVALILAQLITRDLNTIWVGFLFASIVVSYIWLSTFRYYAGMFQSAPPYRSFFALPYIVTREIGLFVLSFYKYKRGTVTWKGRPVSTK